MCWVPKLGPNVLISDEKSLWVGEVCLNLFHLWQNLPLVVAAHWSVLDSFVILRIVLFNNNIFWL